MLCKVSLFGAGALLFMAGCSSGIASNELNVTTSGANGPIGGTFGPDWTRSEITTLMNEQCGAGGLQGELEFLDDPSGTFSTFSGTCA